MAPFIGVRGFYISQFGSNPAIAQEFLLNFIATDETMVALHEADPRGPTWIPVLDAIGDDPVFTAFATSGATGQFMPNVPEMGAVWDPTGRPAPGRPPGDNGRHHSDDPGGGAGPQRHRRRLSGAARTTATMT